MKLVLFANDVVGVEITRYLLKYYPNDLSMIVTIDNNKISELAQQNNVSTCIYDSLENVISKFPENVSLGILAWWPKIIKSPLLEMPQQGFINTHPSLLPYNRGKHYNFWALVEQVPFGVTLHRVDSSVDTGAIVAQKAISYDWLDNGESLYIKAQKTMVELFCGAYPELRKGDIMSVSQKTDAGSFHHSSELELASRIDLDKLYPARDLLNLLRARTFEGHPGCWFNDDGARYEISINIKKVLI